jgi:hypothetical protein
MSKKKGQTFRYRFGNETKTFWYRSRICLTETRLFPFGPESALLNQIVMLAFVNSNSGTNSNVMVFFLFRYWNVCGTFAPLLSWHYYYWLSIKLCSRTVSSCTRGDCHVLYFTVGNKHSWIQGSIPTSLEHKLKKSVLFYSILINSIPFYEKTGLMEFSNHKRYTLLQLGKLLILVDSTIKQSGSVIFADSEIFL